MTDIEKNNQLAKAKTSSLQKTSSNIVSRGLSDLALLNLEEAKIADDQFGDEQRTEVIDKTGDIAMNEDFVDQMLVAFTHHSHILFFTNNGIAYSLKAYDISQVDPAVKGTAIVNLLNLSYGEKITAFLPIREFTEGKFIVMATKNGVIKKTDLMAYAIIPLYDADGRRPRWHPLLNYELMGINLDEGDELIAARLTDGSKEILLSTKDGKAVRFKEDEVRSIGRVGRGVKGLELEDADEVVSMELVAEGSTILSVTENGFGKRTDVAEYPVQHRGGKGVTAIKTAERYGSVVSVMQVTDDGVIMMITSIGKIIRIAIKDVPVIDRNMHGVKLVDVEKGEWVTGILL